MTAIDSANVCLTDQKTPRNPPQKQVRHKGPASGVATPPFVPKEPETLEEAGVIDTLVETLIMKHLLSVGYNVGRAIARAICLPGKPVADILADLKNRKLVVYKGTAAMGDFEYTLTEDGRVVANRYLQECSYCGPAPVPLTDYVKSVYAQTIKNERPKAEQLSEAFSDLLLAPELVDRLGPAVNSGRGMFLYGYPGNGKTSIAERITRCFGSAIWIPKALLADGEIIQFYDPQSHEALDSGKPSIVKGEAHDPRWIKIRRPTIVAGGELTMDALEMRYDPLTKITEAPMQLKSNGGTLVIDDFGRQRMDPDELLNRWIVPLEKHYDYLALHSGKKIQVPFDQLIVFSTNLEPKELVDDAFLRRIPYKINIVDPTETQFRELLHQTADNFGIEYCEDAVNHLIETHYLGTGRPLRCCHPRDLIQQIINQARYRDEEPVMTAEGFDFACANYFALL